MWAQILNILLGIWLMAAPEVLNYNGVAANNDQILGPVIASFAIIALSGCTKSVAKFNIPLGVWLLVAPWLLNYENQTPILNDIIAGLLVTVLSFSKRKTDHLYGGGWTAIWSPKYRAHLK